MTSRGNCISATQPPHRTAMRNPTPGFNSVRQRRLRRFESTETSRCWLAPHLSPELKRQNEPSNGGGAPFQSLAWPGRGEGTSYGGFERPSLLGVSFRRRPCWEQSAILGPWNPETKDLANVGAADPVCRLAITPFFFFFYDYFAFISFGEAALRKPRRDG